MFSRVALVSLAFIFGIIAFTFALPVVLEVGESSRKDSSTVSRACTTTTVQSCNITLPTQHAHPTKEGIAVVETQPCTSGNPCTDHTSQTSLSSDQTFLTVDSLQQNTSYTFNVTYDAINTGVSTMLNSLLFRLPVILIIGVSVLLMVGGTRCVSRA